MLYVKTCKIDKLLKDLSDIMICLASVTGATKTMSKQRYFVSMQRLYLTCDKMEYYLEFNLFKKFVRIICIVAGDINLALLFNTQYFCIVDNDL